MDGKQLKNSILQWAIQGKLVEQLPKEGSASDLYEKILAEKQALIKAGKLKKEKPLPPISLEDIPFEIPKEWKWCRIGDIFTLQAGKNIASSEIYNSKSKEHQYPCYGGNGRRGYVSTYNRAGHFCIIGRQGALCGNVNFANGTFYATEHAVVVDVYSNVDVSWSGIFLSALNLNQYATATAQPGLAVANINKVLIPLPPIGEQKRIVAKLEKLLPLIDEFSAAQEQLDKLNKELPEALKKSILQEAIQGKLVPQNPKDEPAQKLLERIAASRNGDVSPWSEAIGSSKNSKKSLSTSLRGAKATKQSKNPLSRIYRENGVWYEQIGTASPKDITDEIPFEIPETWAWCRVERLFDVWSARRVHEKDWRKKGIPFYRAREIGKLADFGTVDNELFIDQSLYEEFSETGIPKKNDMMITAVGTLGKVYVIKDDKPFYFKDGSVLCMSNKANVDPLFYKHCIESPFFRDQYEPESGGTTVATLTMVRFNKYLVPLPPLAEQKRIVAKLEQLFKVL